MIAGRLRSIDLNAPGATRAARVLVPLALGLWSVLLGVDGNFDLYAYHLYNPFALLNGKQAIDFAAAGMHAYFNPLLDVPYYVLNRHLPAPLVCFLWGALHGLNFILVLEIARRVLANLPESDRRRIPLLLAAASMLTAQFLTALGNTMGDNVTALFMLSAVALLLSKWEGFAARVPGAGAWVLAAGVVAGLGVGFKLTAAPGAVALVVAVAGLRMSWRLRIGMAALLCAGVLAGIAITGGWWHYMLWKTYGNPLFPQFGALFPNPLADAGLSVDTRYLPKSATEALLWPFIFSFDALRYGEAKLRQVIWAVAYVGLAAWCIDRLVKRWTGRNAVPMTPEARFVLVFVIAGYAVWLKVFSIGRYLVEFELLLPLLVFVLAASIFAYGRAKWIAALALGFCTLIVLNAGVRSWGHSGYAWTAFEAKVPALAAPSRTAVVALMGNRATAWLATFFPPEVAFTSVGRASFPEGPDYAARAHALLRARDATYVIFPAAHDPRIDRVRALNAVASELGLTHTRTGCSILKRAPRFGFASQLHPRPDSSLPPCEVRPEPEIERSFDNPALVREASMTLARYDLVLDEASCTVFTGRAGFTEWPFYWCRIGWKAP